jgi:hypothetical protein
LDVLEQACKLGGGSRDWIEHDSDLDALRESPRFKALLARLDSGDAPAPQPAVAEGAADESG